ncbi:ribonuclease P protein subunit p40 [Aspergillus candidus]|uniref:Ribonuclease P 40kDa subunit-domain-containing protein n=1 Tax=Aspergillus candidus TaxID=41067 RepID=A0A2I2FPD8_ASPCN|nr:ribonuclease P 40kDa subunit-domain-containing protein [Aspergillus candidus]PLB42498.1 ribonuclease P 40kDa subunit-domain-containing protein [Aspergillus candidus]
MFDFDDDASRHEKCYTTLAQLSASIDPNQPPKKRSPFSTILGHPFIHTTEVILSEEVYSSVQSALESKLQKLRYGRVFMSLSSLLEGEFFNTYIKSGDILMISEGRSGLDNVFTLKDGILRLELGKEVFERTGLTGKPTRSGARKHAKERYVVELNLRLPSMLHGKKGFERIVWAFKNVLNHSVAWLFYDLAPSANGVSPDDITLKGNHPHIIDCQPTKTTHSNVLVPPFDGLNPPAQVPEEDLRDHSEELSEWLAMVSLGSPRVQNDDDVDPYLCRYSVPRADEASASNLVSLKWHGFIPPAWIMQLFVLLLRETSSSAQGWFALSSSALGRTAVEAKDGYSVLALPSVSSSQVGGEQVANEASKDGRRSICWEFVGASVLGF